MCMCMYVLVCVHLVHIKEPSFHTHTHTHSHTYTHTHRRNGTQKRHTRTYTHTHTHTHTHTCIYTHTQAQWYSETSVFETDFFGQFDDFFAGVDEDDRQVCAVCMCTICLGVLFMSSGEIWLCCAVWHCLQLCRWGWSPGVRSLFVRNKSRRAVIVYVWDLILSDSLTISSVM